MTRSQVRGEKSRQILDSAATQAKISGLLRKSLAWVSCVRLARRANGARRTTGQEDRACVDNLGRGDDRDAGIAVNNAGIAQLVERNLAKVEVASSNLVSRSKLRTAAQ